MSISPIKNKLNQLNPIPKKIIRLFARATAKLLLKFNINRQDYIHFVNEQLVLGAQKQNPEASKVELAVRTGIDRRYITDYLKGEAPTLKNNKLSLILSDIKWTLNKYYSGKKKLPKKGPFRTFESICQQWSSGTLTYSAILKELVRIGSVIDHGGEIELVEAIRDDLENDIQYFEMTSELINRTSDTIILNSEAIKVSNKNYQMSAYSTQIPPENIKEIKEELWVELRKYLKNTIELLEKHEANVSPDTYPAYGVSFLEFKDEENSK